MVFIVIQHLSPDYKSMMDELLARHTQMAIRIAEDGMQTEPDTIYLIPPRKNMSILHGKLFLEDQKSTKSLNLPIDIFLRSLAADQGKNAISIILSGTGSDGTLGIRSIKEMGGMIMVQDDRSAKFDGMPKSSISTGLVDFVLPAGKMPDALMSYIKHPFIEKGDSLGKIMAREIDALSKIILILRDYCGIDFSYYKENTITRRLERRVSINRFDTLQEYLVFLSESDKEKETLFRELLIGVTSFFRDADAFNILAQQVIPNLDFSRKNLRIWSTGCSSGEEVYSIAILLEEYITKNKIDCSFKIFASDIDRYALDVAGQGFYPESIVADVDSEYLRKYFTRKENGYLINEHIRKKIIFATHNLMKDPPFLKLDLIICRNLFIYFKPEMQNKVLSMFYHSLNSNGYLFMGSSESIGELGDSFEIIDSKWKIYRPKLGNKPPFLGELTEIRREGYRTDLGYAARLQTSKSEKLYESVANAVLPPSVILDSSDNIIQMINDLNPYLRYRSGRFSQSIFDNLRPDLAVYFHNLLRMLRSGQDEVRIDNIQDTGGQGDKKIILQGRNLYNENIDLHLISILTVNASESEKEQFLLLDAGDEADSRIRQLERELSTSNENLQAMVEELETANEELQSSNEELVSSNEELQSTNEELQAVNEELYTVNSEFQNKIEELIKLNNDLDNILKNTAIGALYLDRKLCIRKITSVVYEITNILPTDMGRPITHITLDNFYKGFMEDLNRVGETLQSTEKEIVDETGRVWIIQIRPYRSEYNAVDGLIITFMDITQVRLAQNERLITQERLSEVMKIANIAWWEWDYSSGMVNYDPKKATMLGYTPEEFPKGVYEITALIHPEDYEITMAHMRDYLEGKSEEWNVIYRIRRKDGTYSWYHDRGRITERNKKGAPLKLIGTVVDITEIRRLESQLQR